MNEEQQKKSRTLSAIVLAGSIALALILAVAHWVYLEDIHRGGLFQLFGNFFAGMLSLVILAIAMAGKFSRLVGVVSAFLIAGTAGYCLLNSLGLMMSI